MTWVEEFDRREEEFTGTLHSLPIDPTAEYHTLYIGAEAIRPGAFVPTWEIKGSVVGIYQDRNVFEIPFWRGGEARLSDRPKILGQFLPLTFTRLGPISGAQPALYVDVWDTYYNSGIQQVEQFAVLSLAPLSIRAHISRIDYKVFLMSRGEVGPQQFSDILTGLAVISHQ